jgi:hypothetical protein
MELQNQTNKSLEMQSNQRLLNTITLSKAIVSGTAQLAPLEMNLTLSETLDQPTVRKVFSGDNATIGFSVVKVLVNRFIESFGFSTKLSESQIEILTIDTIENFKYESLQDIILFFKLARSGKFGSTKRGVDSNLIFGEWFPMYMEQKADLREQQYVKQKSEMNAQLVSIEDVKKTYEKLTEIPFVQRVKNYADSITKDINREQLEVLIQEWESDEQKKPYVQILKVKRRNITQ